MKDVEANPYLRDLVTLLIEAARNAAQDRNGAVATADQGQQAYEAGRLMAYYEVITLMQDQATAFGLDPADLGLDSIDPARELL